MKRIIIVILISGLFSCATAENDGSEDLLIARPSIDESIFNPLEEEVQINRWGLNNKRKAEIFEEIYFRYHTNPLFTETLKKYINNDIDKYYWLGIYLDSTYYTEINNYDLSLSILLEGLEKIEQGYDKTSFLWIIGKKYYYNEDKANALKYLTEGNQYSLDYPGTTPAFDSEEEYDELMNFINNG